MTEICDTLHELHIDVPAAIWAGFPVALPRHSMTISSSSSEASSETSETGQSSGDPSVRKPWCRWLPRSYLVVFVINATATLLLWPADIEYHPDPRYIMIPVHSTVRLFFFGLMLSSLGAGCVAAFLVRRAEASGHTKWACGYAIINWIQAMLGSLGMDNPTSGLCRYGVIPPGYPALQYLVFCTCILPIAAVSRCFAFWMQTLIASRLDLLEQSSNRSYRSGCFRRLMWAQVFGAAGVLLPIAGVLFYSSLHYNSNNVTAIVIIFATSAMWSLIAIGGITLLCNCGSEHRGHLLFPKVLLRSCGGFVAWQKPMRPPISARSSLRRARRFAGLQGLGVSFSLLFTVLLVPARVFSAGLGNYDSYDSLKVVLFLIQAFDALGNAVAVLLLSGSHRMAKVERSQGSQCGCWKVEKA